MDTNATERFNPVHTIGLTAQEVLLRKQQGQTNTPPKTITKSTARIVRENVFTLFNAYNLIIGVLLAFVGAYANMAYLLIILFNTLIGIVQGVRAKRIVEKLSVISAPHVIALRSGAPVEIAVEEMVLDDITMLEAGAQVCADSVVVSGEIEVNEALLSGEADAILKRPGDTLFSGSFVLSGKCHAKVERVGAANFATKLVEDARRHKHVNSELVRSMRLVTRFTSYFVLPIGLLLVLQAYLTHSVPLDDVVISTSAALLGMLPKGLVFLISVSLAVAVIKLSRKHTLVQEFYSIETLARVDTLCLDKTGTLTQGKMSVSDVCALGDASMPVSVDEALALFVNAADDNNATFMALCERFKAQKAPEAAVVSKTPFSSARKWSAVTFENIGSIVLGAPEVLLGAAPLPEQVLTAQKAGRRIICLGFTREAISGDKLPQLKLAAAIVLDDPLRENAKETLEFFKKEGVRVKMISGDNPLSVSSLAKQAGLAEYASCVDLSKLTTDEELFAAAKKYTVFGRVSPEQKRKLIKALQAQGHTVAMTGDGVNDVLALREADCSVAMASGSDAARQAAQLVLLNSDFSVLTDILMEGRRVVNNTTKVASIFLIKTFYALLLSIFSIFMFESYPFIPLQITLYDLVIEAFPSFFLSLEPNRARVRSGFLRNVVRSALPYALLVFAGMATIAAFAPVFGVPQGDTETIMFYVTGFVGILALFKACRPFNPLRVFILVTACVGFYAAAYLLADVLEFARLGRASFAFYVGLAALCIPLRALLALAVKKLSPARTVKFGN